MSGEDGSNRPVCGQKYGLLLTSAQHVKGRSGLFTAWNRDSDESVNTTN